jgi:hypothetical protein
MIRSKSTWQRIREGPPHTVSTYALTPNNYDHNKKTRWTKKTSSLSLFKTNS